MVGIPFVFKIMWRKHMRAPDMYKKSVALLSVSHFDVKNSKRLNCADFSADIFRFSRRDF